MKLKRSSGILAHPTSFPSEFGIGDLGSGAYDFVDFIHKSGQELWQVLPLCPTGYGDSPYQSFSTFAGNVLLISPEFLVREGYLTEGELENPPSFDPLKVDYGEVIGYKDSLYRKAFERANTISTDAQRKAYLEFCSSNASWLDDFVLFTACKRYFIEARRNSFESPEYLRYKKNAKAFMPEDLLNDCYYGAVWNTWPDELKFREPNAVKKWSEKLADELEYLKFLQHQFFVQWQALRDYANGLDVKIIGDIPIFVALDSSDVWADRESFHLDPQGYPTAVAGVPPDYFSKTGQLWGNPLYDWKKHKESGFSWWIKRIESCLALYDILRIDHFRGFDEYWSVNYGDETAEFGSWLKGPGNELFIALEESLGELPIIAEDLGIITESVEKLRRGLNFPGMRVLQFAFDGTATNEYLPHNYETPATVVYTGTHDNDTTLGWYNSSDDIVKDNFRRYLNVSGDNASWDMIRLALSSTAAYAIIPIQDVLSLGTEARMNTPGTPSGNWQFRYTNDMLRKEITSDLKYITEMFNRHSRIDSN